MQRCLEKAGFGCTIARLQGKMPGIGCGYTLRVHRQDILPVIEELQNCGIRHTRVYEEKDGGVFEEYKYDIP